MLECSYKNLRDLGGTDAADGRKIKNGMIFRGPVLYSKNKKDIDFLNSLCLDSVFDLRSDEEVKEKKDPELKGCRYVRAKVFDGEKYKYIVVTVAAKLRCITLKGNKETLLKQNKLDSYCEMPFSNAFSEVFEAMDRGERFLFHCTEGKDRTGICAALIEYLLGADELNIEKNYMLSNKLRPNKDRNWLKKFGLSQRLIEDISYCEQTHSELLQMSRNAVLEKYGTFEKYFELQFGIFPDRVEKWRSIYLED